MDNEEDQINITFRLLDSQPRAAILTAKGYIQSGEARHLRDTLDHIDAKEARRVIMDLRNVPYMSSSGIGIIVGYCKTKNEQEGCGAVAVIGLTRSVQNIMHTLGLSSMIPQFEDVLSATKALGVEVDTDHLGEVFNA